MQVLLHKILCFQVFTLEAPYFAVLRTATFSMREIKIFILMPAEIANFPSFCPDDHGWVSCTQSVSPEVLPDDHGCILLPKS